VLSLVDNQVRSLRKRQVIESFRADKSGMYIGIRSDIADFPVSVLPADHVKTTRLADLATRLSAMSTGDQERLINWGYIVCDAGLRSHVAEEADVAGATPLPYPNEPVT
jgi:NTE family protein